MCLLERTCNNDILLVRKSGSVRATLLRRRLDEMRVANNLEVLRSLPQVKCHELKGSRAGTLAVALDHPYRLIFEPATTPIQRKSDGGLDWPGITVIRILAVEDYHG